MSKYSVIRKDEIIVEADSPEEAEALAVEKAHMSAGDWNTVAIEVQDGEAEVESVKIMESIEDSRGDE